MQAEQPLLRTKLLKWLLVPLALLLTADTFISYWISLRFAERAYDHALVEIGREVTLHLDTANGGLRFEMPEAARSIIFNDPRDTLHYEVADARGALVAGERIHAPRSADTQDIRLYDGEIEGRPVRIVELRVSGPAGAAAAGYVRVAETKVKRNELAHEIVLSVVVPQVLLIVLAGVLVWVGVVRGLSPLTRLQEAVASRSYRDRSPVVVAEVPGEVRPLMDAINKLLERLDNVLTVQNRFIADAAHQLKTPVAALQAQLEATLADPDPQRTRESLANILAGLERLSRLVSQLLALARNEPDAVRHVTMSEVDLNEIAFESASAWVAEALKRNIDLGFDGTQTPLVVRGDPIRLRELLDNLIDNAIRYSHEGGRVTVCVTPQPTPTVAVSDDGPGIPPDERQRMFERFHRRLGTAAEGSGLGLAIAQEIARIHGGHIDLCEDLDGVGNTFSVSLPHA